MDRTEALDQLLDAYEGMYNVKREDPLEPFYAEAAFHMKNENYFLIKSAKYFESHAHEYTFFANVDELTAELLDTLHACAWNEGMSRVEIGNNHWTSDVSLVIFADTVAEGCVKKIRRTSHHKSYKHGLEGYSHLHLMVYEVSSGKYYKNGMGDHLVNTARSVFEHKDYTSEKKGVLGKIFKR